MGTFNKWWGYLHVNNKIQVKRYFSNLDIEEAQQSPFAKQVFGPFHAETRDQAIRKIKNILNG